MIVVYNEATQDHFSRSQFVFFRCQKYVRKGYIEMRKKIYLESLKKCARSLHFPLLVDSLDFCKGIFLLVIPVRIILPCRILTR